MQFEGLLAHLVGAVQLLAQRILPAEDVRENTGSSVPTATDNETVDHLAKATEIVCSAKVMSCAAPR